MLRTALRSVVSNVASGIDRAFYNAALSRSESSRKASRAESLGHAERMEGLAKICALYDRDEHFSDSDSFFTRPSLPSVTTSRVGSFGNGEILDLGWKSGYAPFLPDLAEKYLSRASNATACARLYAHPRRGHPAILLVHGYMGGPYAVESRVWPVSWLYRRGLDVALTVLPFHGPRAGGTLRPAFPASDPRVTVEGFRQAMWDLRSLVHWLKDRGAPAVGVMGMSLGGYTSALLATVEREVAFAVPVVPLASIADFAREGGRLVGTDEEKLLQHAAIEAAHRVISPLSRAPKTPRERIKIIAGEADRITPIAHARRLGEHFGAEVLPFHGGHLLQSGRGDALRAAAKVLFADVPQRTE
jgi:pimeloyl-ACP methyl ester carboxylesterase